MVFGCLNGQRYVNQAFAGTLILFIILFTIASEPRRNSSEVVRLQPYFGYRNSLQTITAISTTATKTKVLVKNSRSCSDLCLNLCPRSKFRLLLNLRPICFCMGLVILFFYSVEK